MSDAKDFTARILGAFMLADQVSVESLDPDSDAYIKAKMMEERFTAGVDFLRTKFPNDHVRALMTLAWDAIGSKRVPTALGPPVKTIVVAVLQTGQAAIFLPHDWLGMVAQDAAMQLGALVFIGSQAVDILAGRHFVDPDKIIPRARANEAEYLITLREAGMALNPYQKAVVAEYPRGLASDGVAAMLYPMSPCPAPS